MAEIKDLLDFLKPDFFLRVPTNVSQIETTSNMGGQSKKAAVVEIVQKV